MQLYSPITTEQRFSTTRPPSAHSFHSSKRTARFHASAKKIEASDLFVSDITALSVQAFGTIGFVHVQSGTGRTLSVMAVQTQIPGAQQLAQICGSGL